MTNSDRIKPGEVRLEPVPLVGVLGNAEMEQACAAIVAACVDAGRWYPVRPCDVKRAVLSRATDMRWIDNPFFRPNYRGLVKAGWARFFDGENCIELTDKAIERLAEKARATR